MNVRRSLAVALAVTCTTAVLALAASAGVASAAPATDSLGDLSAEISARRVALVEPLDEAGRRERAALDRALTVLAGPSADLAGDVALARRLTSALGGVYATDGELVALQSAALASLAARLETERSALERHLTGFAPSGSLQRAHRSLNSADAALRRAGTAGPPVTVSRLLERASRSITTAGRTASRAPSFVVARVDGAPYAARVVRTTVDVATGFVSLYADDPAPGRPGTVDEIHVLVRNAAVPGSQTIGFGPSSAEADFTRKSDACGAVCPRYDGETGTVTITRIDAGEGAIDGTFNFHGVRRTGGSGSVSVTEGVFHLRYPGQGTRPK